MKKIILVFLGLFFFFSTPAVATIGVGVGTGKIQVDQELKPGIIYDLPPLTVVNTGDEASDYEIDVSYHEKQPELQPQKSWFIFSPQQFHLNPGETQVVNMKLNLPVRAEPGKYFAYLEGHPFKTSQSGNTTIGIAAAAKLYFTVTPANIFAGFYYKFISFWHVYAPWPLRVTIMLAVLILILVIKKFLNIEINLKKPSRRPNKSEHRVLDRTEMDREKNE